MNDQRNKIVQIMRLMHSRGLISGLSGNASIRIKEDNLLITPSGYHKAFLKPEHIVLIDFEGKLLEGSLRPSSEWRMHVEIYRRYPSAKAIVHAHPPYTLAIGKGIETVDIPELRLAVGNVGFVPPVEPGTRDLADRVAAALKNAKIAIMEKHGVVSMDEDILRAEARIEALEEICKIVYLTTLKK